MSDHAPSPTEGPMASQRKLAELFDTSTMTIWRWRRSIADFPKPIVIAGRNYWSIAAVERWKASLVGAAKAHHPPSKGARGDKGEALVEAEGRPRRRGKKAAAAQEAPAPAAKRRGRR
jgi:hypothetical protein